MKTKQSRQKWEQEIDALLLDDRRDRFKRILHEYGKYVIGKGVYVRYSPTAVEINKHVSKQLERNDGILDR